MENNPIARLFILIGALTIWGCESQECGRENPNYNPNDPTSTACLEGTSGLAIPSTLGGEKEREEEEEEAESQPGNPSPQNTGSEEQPAEEEVRPTPEEDAEEPESEVELDTTDRSESAVPGDAEANEDTLQTDADDASADNPEDIQDAGGEDEVNPETLSCSTVWSCYLECAAPTGCLAQCAGTGVKPDLLEKLSDLLFCWEFICAEQDWDTCQVDGCAAEWQLCEEEE